MTLPAPSTCAINKLLAVCNDFAKKNHIEFSAAKSVVLLLLPKTLKLVAKPNVYLGESVLSYLERLESLGHILTVSFTDDEDIVREKLNLIVRCNFVYVNLICVQMRLSVIYLVPIVASSIHFLRGLDARN